MALIRALVPTAPKPNLQKAMPVTDSAGALADALATERVVMQANRQAELQGTPDARQLRQLRWTRPHVYRAINKRCYQVPNQPWDIAPVDARKRYSKSLQQEIRSFFRRPNPGGKHNSFPAFTQVLVDELMTLDLFAAYVQRQVSGRPTNLQILDAARLKIRSDWDSESDGPRYWYADPDGKRGKLFNDTEILLIQQHRVAYADTGLPGLRSVMRSIGLMDSAFERMQVMQDSGGAAGILNLVAATNEQVTEARRRYQTASATGNIAFTNYDTDEMQYQPLQGVNLEEQGTFKSYETGVLEISAGLDVTPFDLMRQQHDNRATSDSATNLTLDDGVIPLMRTIANAYNRNLVETFGDPDKINLQFVWTALASDDTPEDAQALRALWGPQGSWMSINQVLLASGMPAIEPTGDDMIDAALNEPRLPIGPGDVTLPLSIYIHWAARQAGLDPDTGKPIAEDEGPPPPNVWPGQTVPPPQTEAEKQTGKTIQQARNAAAQQQAQVAQVQRKSVPDEYWDRIRARNGRTPRAVLDALGEGADLPLGSGTVADAVMGGLTVAGMLDAEDHTG